MLSPKYDVVYMLREAVPLGPPVLELLTARVARRLVIDFDDAIYLPSLETNISRHPLINRFKYARSFERVLRASKHVVAGNGYLGQYARQFNPNVTVIPTVVDLSQYPTHGAPRSSPITIGFRGSPSTSHELLKLREVFERLWRRYGHGVRFVVHGDPLFAPLVPNMVAKPFDLETQIQDLVDFDVGIMPLTDDEWTRGKCGAKAVEYGAVAIPTVSSPVGVASEIIEHGVTGYLASTSDEWATHLSSLIEDLELRLRLGAAARERIAMRYSVERAFPLLLEVLTEQAGRASFDDIRITSGRS